MNENPYSNMDRPAYRIAYLIAGYIKNTLSEKEHYELNEWVNENDHNMQLFEELTDENNLDANLAWLDKAKAEESFRKLKEQGAFEKSQRRFSINPVLAVAASMILLLCLFLVYRYAGDAKNNRDRIVSADTLQLHPGGNKATLTLADGSVINLTEAKTGLLKKVSGFEINKTGDGELAYETRDRATGISAIHTLSTPVGGQFQLKLPDGTKVWLNAATTLKYAAAFSGKERRVELSGEAYFEVVKNEKSPFRVSLTDSSFISVLGTHFNVMAYENEKTKEVTLLEGSVAVSKGSSSEALVPGMQAILTNQGITKNKDVDTEEIIGWKDGLFVFHDASLESLMRQIERWYDAKVVYHAEVKEHFNGSLSRSESLSKLLHILELTGSVHFKIDNKTIYVLP